MSDEHDEMLKLVEKMPAFPQAVMKVLDMTSRAECSPKELVKVIEHDPVMTVKILKLVNSAFYGLSKPIHSINHGVVYAGFNTIKNLSLTIAAIGMLPRQNDINFDMHEFLLHSLGVAVTAKRLAGILGVGGKDTSDFFVAGLLHDFGKVVLAQFKPEKFRLALDLAEDGGIPLYQAEREILGIDHAEIGGLLAESWKLPDYLADCIRNHHNPDSENGAMGDCIFAANQVVQTLSFGDSGNRFITPFPENIRNRFGRDLPGLIDGLGDLIGEMEQARSFIQQ